MTSKMRGWLGVVGTTASVLLLLVGCGDDSGGLPTQTCGPDGTLIDDDGDFIPNNVEGFLDDDGDGIVNFFDLDSDNDGILDIDEGEAAMDCTAIPRDLDQDGLPDFRDPDANGDGLRDTLEQDGAVIDVNCNAEPDEDGNEPEPDLQLMFEDGIPDYQQDDLDGDTIFNWDETGLDGSQLDSDGDCIPDVWDTDSDNDGVLDETEGPFDFDGDGFGNFRDLDSDGDGISDADETNDDGTPKFCPNEIDPSFDPEVDDEPELDESDTLPDYLDRDSDNDGLTDGEESLFGTDLCNWDSDGDGQSDLVESVFERINCPDGPDAPGAVGCGCAADADCMIPPTDFFVVLPFNGRAIERRLTFDSRVLAADVLMMVHEHFRMDDLDFRARTPFTHFTENYETLIDEVAPASPDTWFGFATWDEIPLAPYAETRFSNPNLLRLHAPIQSPDAYDRTTFDRIAGLTTSSGNNDSASAHTEAIFQVLSDFYTTYTNDDGMARLDPMAFPDCDGERAFMESGMEGDEPLDLTFGKACFRRNARPIIVQAAMNCAHAGPPGRSGACNGYEGISPSPTSWDEVIFEMNRRGARYIGINAITGFSNPNACGIGSPAATSNPCYYMFNTGIQTGAIDQFGDALLIDHTAEDGPEDLIANVSTAVQTVVNNAPIDVDTAVRDDRSDFVDATAFIRQRRPACSYDPVEDTTLPDPRCWEPAPGLAPEESVALIDQSTFFDILPGTQVSFDVTFQNLTVPGEDVARAYVAFLELRADRRNLISSRQVIVIVPAAVGEGPT